MFFYKFYNNILGINTRTSHFVPNGTRNCFFCTKLQTPLFNDESFSHLFYDCGTTSTWQNSFLNKHFPELLPLNRLDKKKLWFLGYTTDIYHSFILAAFLSFQFCIWEAKLSKKIPSFHFLENTFLERFGQTLKHNSAIYKSMLKSNYALCRYFLGGGQGGPAGGHE
jgi:hypothetical protein